MGLSKSKINLVCIHGNSQNRQAFKNLHVEGCEKILVDLPGHGGKPVGSVTSFLTMVDAVYEEVKAIPNAAFVGLSLGGHVVHHMLDRLKPLAVFSIAAPPLKDLSSVPLGFLPHPFFPYLFQNQVNNIQASELARTMLTDRHPDVEELTQMILTTSSDIRGLIGASLNRGEFRNEIELVKNYQGKKVLVYPTRDNFVNESYIKSLNIAPVKDIMGAHVLTMDNPQALQAFIRLVLFGR